MLTPESPAVYTDIGGLAKLKLAAREQSPEAAGQVAKQFESIFVNMMLKSMRQAKLSDGILDSQQSEFYRDMYDQQIALHLTGKPGQHGIGLAEFIVKQLGPKNAEGGKTLDGYLPHDADGEEANGGVSSNRAATAANSGKPMDASGLSSLERVLARLEAQQKAMAEQWLNQDDEWQSQKTGDDRQIASKQAFIEQLLPHAQQAAAALGVDANLLLAQAALETGWGQAVIKNAAGESSFNLFNIKADKSWQGKQAKAVTLEFDGGVAKKEMAGFRAYDSYKASFDDYVNFIKSNPRYSEALKKAGNPVKYVLELQQAGYATDPRYAEKIINIFNAQIAGPARAAKDAG